MMPNEPNPKYPWNRAASQQSIDRGKFDNMRADAASDMPDAEFAEKWADHSDIKTFADMVDEEFAETSKNNRHPKLVSIDDLSPRAESASTKSAAGCLSTVILFALFPFTMAIRKSAKTTRQK